MLGRYPSIYHFHIPKCGGTSLAWWLARHICDRRPFDRRPMWNAQETFGPISDSGLLLATERQQQPYRRQAFFATDLVSTHAPLGEAARDAAFRFTVLRKPAARVVSQFADWRRLGPQDLAGAHPLAASVVADASRTSLAAFLEKHGRRVNILNNYMTRTLAALSLSLPKRQDMALKDLADVAIENLEAALHFVGISEQPQTTIARLADLLGLAPDFEPPRMNRTDSEQALALEAAQAADALSEITAYDQRVYDHALKLFARRDAVAGRVYDRAAFERLHAATAARQLTGRALDGDVVFSVRDPFLGCGFHGRDGAGLETCCVWSGPSNAFVLYMPAPEGARLQLKLWVRGYANLAQREALRVRVDGQTKPHGFEPAQGYAEVLVTETRAQRPFVALEIDVGATATTGEMGAGSYDSRLRGVAFDRYGWRALPD